jgi:biopolymer transport protein ExbD
VFFLLLHSSDVEVLPSAKAVKLPESLAEKQPKATVVVVVNDEEIIVQGRRVAAVADVMSADSEVIAALKTELDHQATLGIGVKRGQAPDAKTGREVTIMGDKEIPYRLLKKIMLTCVRASYDNISLAVLKKAAT